jgi:hypothetical protein
LTRTDDGDKSFGSLGSFAGLEDEPFRRALKARPATAGGVVVDGGMTTWIGDRGDRGGGNGAKQKLCIKRRPVMG